MSNQKKSKKIPKVIQTISKYKDIFERIDDYYIEHGLCTSGLPLTSSTLSTLDSEIGDLRKCLMIDAKIFFNEDFIEVVKRWLLGGIGYSRNEEYILKVIEYLRKLNELDRMIYDYHIQLIEMRKI